MRRSESSYQIEPGPEIERTRRLLLKEKREREVETVNNEEHKALKDYVVQSNQQLHHALSSRLFKRITSS